MCEVNIRFLILPTVRRCSASSAFEQLSSSAWKQRLIIIYETMMAEKYLRTKSE